MKKNLPNVYILTAICLITALLLAVVNAFTLPVIKAAEDRATQAALLEVLPSGGSFTKVDLETAAFDRSSLETEVEEIFKASGRICRKASYIRLFHGPSDHGRRKCRGQG